MRSELSPLQRDFLQAFFRTTRDFYLTGGGALIGYYQWPRHSDDLDLFSASVETFEHVHALMARVCTAIDAAAEQVQSSSYFYRYVLRRAEESIQVDLVLEPSPRAHPDKREFDGIVVDVPDEIFASKICTLVHRAEPRDFWDVYQFVQRGYLLDAAMADAAVKEGGIDAESLVMVLSDIDWQVLQLRAQKAGLKDFDKVTDWFKSLVPELARRLLPPAK